MVVTGAGAITLVDVAVLVTGRLTGGNDVIGAPKVVVGK